MLSTIISKALINFHHTMIFLIPAYISARRKKLKYSTNLTPFTEFCKKHNLNHQETPTTYTPIIPEPASVDVEQEFWKTECFKLTPDGVAVILTNGRSLL
jgi:hypothetical protein